MICICCGKDKPEKHFSPTTFTYVTKKGVKRVYHSIRKKCNGCTWNKYEKKKSEKLIAY